MACETTAKHHRKDRRIKQWNKASIKASTAPQGQIGAAAFTYDLSLSGARIHSPELFEVGSMVCLRIELVRSRETIAIEGEIKWARPSEAEGTYEMGVEFKHSSSQAVMILMKNLHDSKR